MHFTLWPSLTVPDGGHLEITWETFLGFVADPVIAADKSALEGWSPAKFRDNHRDSDNVELLSAIVLDDDASKLATAQLVNIWQPFAGVVHTSFSHTPEHPKHRIVLPTSRDMTAEEQGRVRRFVGDYARAHGEALDEVTKDAARFWYVPGHREEAPYEWAELKGTLLDVDAILAATPAQVPPTATAPAPRVAAAAPSSNEARRKAAAATLGSVWPAQGRHVTQLALAGGLVHDGWSEEDAVAFLRETCRFAGNEEPEKRAQTARHTIAKRDAGEPFTGWSTLAEHIDPGVVQHVRDLLSGTAATNARMAEIESARNAPAPVASNGIIEVDGLRFETSGLDAPLPAIPYQLGTFIARGEVIMFVAQGNSLKTWLAFSIAHAIASGRPWLGQFMVLRGRVGILDFESGQYEVKRRLKLLQVKDAEVEGRLLRCSYPDGLDLTKIESWVTLSKLRLDMLVIDSFNAAVTGVDENDARSAEMLKLAGKFAERTDCSVIVIHHARKGSGGDEREQVRGSTALYAACDRVFSFAEPNKQEDGIVLTTMKTIKDGAGRRPPPVRVELSDQGLRWVEMTAEPVEEEPTEAVFRRKMIELVERTTSGVNRERLIDAMPGTKTKRREIVKRVLAGLLNDGVLTECKLGKQVLYTRNWVVAA
jgi:hypothetical protein